MKIKLPDCIASSQDIADVIIEIHEYSKWFAHESIKAQAKIGQKTEQPTLSPTASQIIRDWSSKNDINQQSLDLLTQILNDYIKKSPSITITLAAPPTANIKTSLVKWCRTNIATDILVNFQFNSTLLGGMVVRYGSRIFDWSFRRQILNERYKFAEVLRRV